VYEKRKQAETKSENEPRERYPTPQTYPSQKKQKKTERSTQRQIPKRQLTARTMYPDLNQPQQQSRTLAHQRLSHFLNAKKRESTGKKKRNPTPPNGTKKHSQF